MRRGNHNATVMSGVIGADGVDMLDESAKPHGSPSAHVKHDVGRLERRARHRVSIGSLRPGVHTARQIDEDGRGSPDERFPHPIDDDARQFPPAFARVQPSQ